MKQAPVEVTVNAYSGDGADAYEDPSNWNSVYGNMTRRFLNQIEVPPGKGIVLDAGCGTGLLAAAKQKGTREAHRHDGQRSESRGAQESRLRHGWIR